MSQILTVFPSPPLVEAVRSAITPGLHARPTPSKTTELGAPFPAPGLASPTNRRTPRSPRLVRANLHPFDGSRHAVDCEFGHRPCDVLALRPTEAHPTRRSASSTAPYAPGARLTRTAADRPQEQRPSRPRRSAGARAIADGHQRPLSTTGASYAPASVGPSTALCGPSDAALAPQKDAPPARPLDRSPPSCLNRPTRRTQDLFPGC